MDARGLPLLRDGVDGGDSVAQVSFDNSVLFLDRVGVLHILTSSTTPCDASERWTSTLSIFTGLASLLDAGSVEKSECSVSLLICGCEDEGDVMSEEGVVISEDSGEMERDRVCILMGFVNKVLMSVLTCKT